MSGLAAYAVKKAGPRPESHTAIPVAPHRDDAFEAACAATIDGGLTLLLDDSRTKVRIHRRGDDTAFTLSVRSLEAAVTSLRMGATPQWGAYLTRLAAAVGLHLRHVVGGEMVAAQLSEFAGFPKEEG